jgi:hypothetical protein
MLLVLTVLLASSTPVFAYDNPPLAQPTIDWPRLNHLLWEKNSPIYVESHEVFKALLEEGADPAVALAFAEYESTFGKYAPVPYSTFNIRCNGNGEPGKYTTGWTCIGGWRSYPNWATSVRDWAKLMRYYQEQLNLSGLSEVLHLYAPYSDGNNVSYYYSVTSCRLEYYRGSRGIC